jgi:hypothetical protein
MSDNVQVLDVRDLLVQSRKLVEMSRKQAERMDLRCNVPNPLESDNTQQKGRLQRTRILPMPNQSRRRWTSLQQVRT